jgi:hypothetical protein
MSNTKPNKQTKQTKNNNNKKQKTKTGMNSGAREG